MIDADGVPARFAGRIDGPESDSAWLAALQPRPDAPARRPGGRSSTAAPALSELTPDLMAAVTTTAHDAARMAATRHALVGRRPAARRARALLGLLHFGARDERGRPAEALVSLYEAIADRAAGALAATRLVADLNRTRRRFERILGVLAEAVTVRDPDGRVVYGNEAAARLLGVASPAALVGTGQELTRAGDAS